MHVCFSKKEGFFLYWIFQWVQHPAASVNVQIHRCKLFSVGAPGCLSFLRILAFAEELNTWRPKLFEFFLHFFFSFTRFFLQQDKCTDKQDQQAPVRYYLMKLFLAFRGSQPRLIPLLHLLIWMQLQGSISLPTLHYDSIALLTY